MIKNEFINKTVLLFIVFFIPGNLLAQSTYTLGDLKASPGESVSGYLKVPAGNNSSGIEIPVSILNGTKPGPVLAITAGVHGYEYPPILALQRILKDIDLKKLSGTVVLVHIMNIQSFQKRTIYYNPEDGKNLNREFPGNPEGTITERIANTITSEVIEKCDYLIDMHCGDGNENLIPYLYCSITGNKELDEKIKGMSVNFGINIIVKEKNLPGDKNSSLYVDNTAISRGIPAITVESGKLGRSDEEDIVRLTKGIWNILYYLKMAEGKPEKVSDPVWIEEYQIMNADKTGIFYPLLSRGSHVQNGQMIGYLTDYFGSRIQEFKSPYDGIILYIVGTPPMNSGEPVASIGRFNK